MFHQPGLCWNRGFPLRSYLLSIGNFDTISMSPNPHRLEEFPNFNPWSRGTTTHIYVTDSWFGCGFRFQKKVCETTSNLEWLKWVVVRAKVLFETNIFKNYTPLDPKKKHGKMKGFKTPIIWVNYGLYITPKNEGNVGSHGVQNHPTWGCTSLRWFFEWFDLEFHEKNVAYIIHLYIYSIWAFTSLCILNLGPHDIQTFTTSENCIKIDQNNSK